MALIEVQGGRKLYGEAKIQGSKNAVLPILAACILCEDTIEIRNCPKIADVFSMIDLLTFLGCKIKWEKHTLFVQAKEIQTALIPEFYTKRMRSSILLLGSMLGRTGKIMIAYPGGCSIGKRPIDIHLSALEQLKIQIMEDENLITCQTKQAVGTTLELSYPSVGATENIILSSVLAKGRTRIINSAKEPEINELCDFLRSMGAEITGDGTEEILITGVEKLSGTTYFLKEDRIVAGTYMIAVSGTGGDVFFPMENYQQLEALFQVLTQMGVWVNKRSNGVQILSAGKLSSPGLIRTKPYPGFPTDLQSQIMALTAKADGITMIIENIFEERFHAAGELRKMGADISVTGRAAVINGKKTLTGANVVSADLRGGAALVLAGLMGEGKTQINNPYFIERGYEDICQSLRKLGADIVYVEEQTER